MSELIQWHKVLGFTKAENNMVIYYSPEAYVKTQLLVKFHSEEIGWNMVIKPYKDGYKVYDILVYPQKVSSAYIDVDLSKYGIWKSKLTEEEDANLFGQGHSHVNMEAYFSGVDEKQQYDEISVKKTGFYFFEVWNKQSKISSRFYDLDKKVVYLPENITYLIDLKESELGEFVEKSFEMLS